MRELPGDHTTLVVPTELERGDAFADGAVLAGVVLGAWYLALQGLFAFSIPFIIGAAVWTLTGEAVTDVPFLGALAAGFRYRLGLRRAHEWVLAYSHYFAVRTWPDWRSRWHASRLGRRVKLPTPRHRRKPVMLQAALEVYPTTNYVMASTRERGDLMDSLARVLMGLSHRVQVIGQTRPDPLERDWDKPPTLTRRWLVVVRAPDEAQLSWRLRTAKRSLEGVGLRCEQREVPADRRPVRIYPDCLRVGDREATEWCASVVLRRWPREVAPGWLGQALAGDVPADVGIHVLPQDPQRIARYLKKQQAWQTDVGPQRDAGNELGRRDAEVTRQKLIARTDRPVKVAIVLTVWAASREELRQHVQTLGHEIGLALGDVRLAKYEQDYGREATEPTGRCRMLGVWRTLDCESVASTWILQPGTVIHHKGAEIGTTHDGGMLVKIDPFDLSLESFGALLIAKTGAGKSFLLQLIARRLQGVEVWVVEQHDPPEFATVPGIHTLNLADIEHDDDARAQRLHDFIIDLWEAAKADTRPRLLILDELYGLLRTPLLADLVAQLARRGRKHYLSLWIATQQVRELLKHPDTLDNAAIRIYLKQHDRDLDDLCDAAGLPAPARRFLRGAARGQALLDCGGMLVPVDIQASASEYWEITTDPRDRERQANGRVANLDGTASVRGVADLVSTAAQGPAGGSGTRTPVAVDSRLGESAA